LGEIKTILNQNNGKMAGEGAVRWMFERKGLITANSQFPIPNFQTKEELELAAIEWGAEDIRWKDSEVEIYTKPEDLEKVKKTLEERQLKIDSANLGYFAKEEVEISEREKEQAEKLFSALDDNDAVNDIYSNLK
jgi:transcriptional/translational regulatory protein YebC/TACO1